MSEKYKDITFIDFCAGIGGSRFVLENLGMKCLVDKVAEITYREFLKAKGNHK
jgi:site-specific DNA-cytosine methylase